jgi:hypothetical protein
VALTYSTQIVQHAAVSGGPYDEYVVPDGHLLVVKFISIVYGDIVASGLDAWVQTDDLVKLFRYTWAFTLATPTNFGGTANQWGTQVLFPGQKVQTQTAAGTCDITAGGYLLTTP